MILSKESDVLYKVTLSDDAILANQLAVLQAAFSRLRLEVGAPADAAIFDTNDVRPGCVLYFSPGAVRIARQLVLEFSGVETSAPVRSGVGLLAGRQQAWQTVPFGLEYQRHELAPHK